MPADNDEAVLPGGDILFPRNGPASGSGITRVSDGAFRLAEPGVYQVQFMVSVTGMGQLAMTLNGAELPDTMAGQFTGASQLSGAVLIETGSADAVLTLRNPANAYASLMVTAAAGGPNPVSAHLIITRLL